MGQTTLIAAAAALALASLLPVLLVWRTRGLRGRREAALVLHRAQLAEIEREREQGRLAEEEYGAARLEIERRLLASAASADAEARAGGGGLVLALVLLVPLAAGGLYSLRGRPDLVGQVPPAPPPPSAAEQDAAQAASEAAMINRLRDALAQMSDSNPRAPEGYRLLGRVELGRQNLQGAADAYRHALRLEFDPAIAAITAELISEIAGHKTPEALDMWQRALAAAPADAPWRRMVEKRLAEARAEGMALPPAPAAPPAPPAPASPATPPAGAAQ